MNAPLIWILLPGLLALLLALLPLPVRFRKAGALGAALFFTLLAAVLRVDEVQVIGPLAYRIPSEWVVAGRSFVLDESGRKIAFSVYVALAFWLLPASAVAVPALFSPLSLGSAALFLAALTVRPILFAPLLIFGAVLLQIFVLTPPGRAVSAGVLRLLAYQAIAMPFLLIAGWLVSGVDQRTTGVAEIPVPLFLGLGLAFLFGVFPLHSWVPMILEKGESYAAAFAITLMMQVNGLFLVEFLGRYAAQESLLGFEQYLRYAGVVMWGFAGLWSLFQRDLGRMLGFALLAEMGRMLLWLGLDSGGGWYMQTLAPRLLAFGVWALALSLLRPRVPGFQFRDVVGVGRRFPVVSLGIVVAHASAAGLPLLAGFPLAWSLTRLLANRHAGMAVIALLGTAGLLGGVLRTLAVFLMGEEAEAEAEGEERPHWYPRLLVVMGVLGLLVLGLFPQAIFYLAGIWD